MRLFESWAPFGKGKQVRVPTSLKTTEWHFIDLSRSSSKCSFVTSLLIDYCTKCRTSSLPHFLLRFRVSFEAILRVSKSLPLWYAELVLNWEFLQNQEYCHNFALSFLQYQLRMKFVDLWNLVMVAVNWSW